MRAKASVAPESRGPLHHGVHDMCPRAMQSGVTQAARSKCSEVSVHSCARARPVRGGDVHDMQNTIPFTI